VNCISKPYFDGDLCLKNSFICTFYLFFSFSITFIIYIDFTHFTASNAANDYVTSCAHFKKSKSIKNLAITGGFKYDFMIILDSGLFLGCHPIVRPAVRPIPALTTTLHKFLTRSTRTDNTQQYFTFFIGKLR